MTGAAYLLDVVEVDKSRRVRCQAPGCGHAVYARIHVVLDGARFVVLGGDCFQRLYGTSIGAGPSYYGGSAQAPTTLSEAMRALLESNTAEFVAQLELRRLQWEAEAAARSAALARQAGAEARAGQRPPAAPQFSPELGATGTWGRYHYGWSASWWTSAAQLLAGVRAALNPSPQADLVYRAIVALVRQPTVSPVLFAARLESRGVAREAVLDCLHALQLVHRALAEEGVSSGHPGEMGRAAGGDDLVDGSMALGKKV